MPNVKAGDLALIVTPGSPNRDKIVFVRCLYDGRPGPDGCGYVDTAAHPGWVIEGRDIKGRRGWGWTERGYSWGVAEDHNLRPLRGLPESETTPRDAVAPVEA